eukprot:3038580-Amphidinium_carterae.1
MLHHLCSAFEGSITSITRVKSTRRKLRLQAHCSAKSCMANCPLRAGVKPFSLISGHGSRQP